MGLDGYKHKRNLNVLVVGGSGAGKSRTYAIPNIMQCNCSMVITDPKAELLRKTGGVLERNGYEVRVFDLINPETSWCYNPFAYVWDDKDVLKLINNLIRNTTPKGAQSSDPFWEKSETALLQALMLYLLHEAPPEEQNFPMIMECLEALRSKKMMRITSPHWTFCLKDWKCGTRRVLRSSSMPFISRQPVLYALKDFLIKRLGSLLEHTT